MTLRDTTKHARDAASPAPSLERRQHRTDTRLTRAALWPLIIGVCGAVCAWLAHWPGPAIMLAVAGTGTAAVFGLAALASVARAMRFNPWPAIIVLTAGAGAAGWLLAPRSGLGILRDPAVLASAVIIVLAVRRGLRYRQRRRAYHRWAQALTAVLAQGMSQTEQVLAGLAGRLGYEHVTHPHYGGAPAGAFQLTVTRWDGAQIGQARLVLPAHEDITSPDLLIRIRTALTKRVGIPSVSLSPDPAADAITITASTAAEPDEPEASIRDLAVERVKTVAGMALNDVDVTDADVDEEAVPESAGIAGAGHALREFTIAFAPAKIITSPASRDQITGHLSTQLYGTPDRLRAFWDPSRDTARFLLRRDFPDTIPYPVLDVAALWPGRVVIPYGDDEDGNVAIFPLSKTKLPHGLVIGPTGGGKTQLLLALAIGAARLGIEIRGADPKQIELMGLRGWPNVTQIATKVTAMIKMLEDAYDLMHERFEDIAAGRARPGSFRRILIILDEYFVFWKMVHTWWAGERDKSQPKEHPVIGKIAEIAALSRAADMNLVIGCQRPDSTFFYEGARDNFGWRASLGALSPQGAQMLWRDHRIGTDLPDDVPGLCTATTANGPARVKVYWVPNPAHALSGDLTDAEITHLRSLLPPGAHWDGPLAADAPDPGFEDSAAAIQAAPDDPATSFLILVKMALSARTAHLTGVPGGGPPGTGTQASRYGWGTGTGGALQRMGTWIGAVEDTDSGRRVYLYPQRAYEAACRFARELEEPLTLSRSQVDEALHASGLLATEEGKDGTHWTVRRPLPGNDLALKDDRQRVWDLPAEALLGEPPAPAGPAGDDDHATAETDPLPGQLEDGDRIILYFTGGESLLVTVHSVAPRGDGHLVINYIREDGMPDAVITPPDQPVRRAPRTT